MAMEAARDCWGKGHILLSKRILRELTASIYSLLPEVSKSLPEKSAPRTQIPPNNPHLQHCGLHVNTESVRSKFQKQAICFYRRNI